MNEKVKVLLGKTITHIYNNEAEIIFTTIEGDKYKMYHYQDCCETVTIEDIIGDLSDLLNSPITMAEEVISSKNPDDIIKNLQDSFTWTFYKFATVNGYVTIRWYGESNGFYSETVDFCKL